MKKQFYLFLFLFFISLSFISAGNLQVTLEHPFLINGSWISASQLHVGDVLTSPDGKKIKITNINEVISAKSFPVYNLEAGVYHDFVVNSNNLSVVVHNSNKIKFLQFPTSPQVKPAFWTNDQWNEYLLSKANILPSTEKPKVQVRIGKQIAHAKGTVLVQGGSGAVFIEEGSSGKRVVKVMIGLDPSSKSPLSQLIGAAKFDESLYQDEIKMMELAQKLGLRSNFREVEITNVESLVKSSAEYPNNYRLLARRAYSMDYVEGVWPEEAIAKGWVNDETLADGIAKYKLLYDAGYMQIDFQFLVTPAGKVEIIDWGSVMPHGSTPFSTIESNIKIALGL